MRSQEHRVLGDEATAGATVNLGGDSPSERFLVSFGDVVALSGDYFHPDGGGSPAGAPGPEALAAGGLFDLAAVPGNRGTRTGTRDELVCALRTMAVDQGLADPRFEAGGPFAGYEFSPSASETDVERRVRDRLLALGAANDDHFVVPGARGVATAADRAAARFGSAGVAYRRLHQRALDEAWRLGRTGGDLSRAMAREAAAQHYLTDAFAAGHLRTPVAAIREFWQWRYPWFWESLQRKVAADTARALRQLAPALRILPAETLEDRALAAVRHRTKGFPQVSLGDLLAKVFHDWDNVHGLVLEGGGVVFGDGCLEQGLTRQLAVAAARAGVDDVDVAYGLGRAGRSLPGRALYAAVREATGASGQVFLAEERIPRPSAENPQLNWWANDLEELWDMPVAGSQGVTVGQAVEGVLAPGEELPRRLGGLGSGILGADVPNMPFLRGWLSAKASRAYREGFLAGLTSAPRASVFAVVAGAAPALAPATPHAA